MYKILDLVNGVYLGEYRVGKNLNSAIRYTFRTKREARMALEMKLASVWFHWDQRRTKEQFTIEKV
jgi:hypothetical protein